jgi:hypothetical protein
MDIMLLLKRFLNLLTKCEVGNMLENIISTFSTYEKKTYIDKEQVTKQLEEIIKNYIRRRDDPDETEEHMAEDIAYELEIFVDELKAI